MRLCAFAWALSTLQTTTWAADVQDADAAEDLAVLSRRRVADLAEFPDPSWFNSVQKWIDTQRPDGTWADVNYLSGCPARRANWPIQEHWNRIITLAAAWSGASLVAERKWANSTEAWDVISNGLDYWFKNDYKPPACMGNGGNATLGCPCGTPGLWNTNWYGQAILIPQLSSTACLLARDGSLSQEQREGCVRLTKRTYDNIDLSYGTGGNLTASNVVLVLQSAVSLGLFTSNATIVESAMDRAFSVMTFSDSAGQDGIHRDGSFLQHDGILYNGNYGKDLLNVFIQLEGEAIGTRFAANDATREAMSTYIKGDEWMIFTDQQRKQEHWDFNVIGRFVSYPTQDLQASADINFNVTKLARAVADFTGLSSVNDTIRRLLSNGTDPLIGNKAFWTSDYMVHRRPSFTIGNKMLSSRSANSELVNGANPLGYHLGQGTLFTYVDGAEYRDVWASWDWDLIPGTTVVLGRPALAATAVKHRGKRDFVGVVSDGRVGAAVEDYLDPYDGHIAYRKAWFYLGDAVLVSVVDVQTQDDDAPVITVLENRAKADGGAFVDGARVEVGNDTRAVGRTLFYGGNGYLAYGAPFDLTLSEGERTGNWSAISTSTAGLATVPIFSAYTALGNASSASYALLPATTRRRLAEEAEKPSWIPVGARGVSGAAGQGGLAVVFWPGAGDGSALSVDLAEVGWADAGTLEVSSGAPGVYLLTGRRTRQALRLEVSAADPTQKLETARLALRFERKKSCRAARVQLNFEFALPTGGMAGSTVQQTASLELW
ncbi:polysaccharide lyase family 8 protein [Cordyceps fumosorosea ARSEF 2679]|uniref:Polysaccharide lyase family 8 protein n=1 Tax=Cordyceps fumosorosea (strain ARSEF 2679) TaxID=1081104 RepID=A0A168B6E3_CORFA|nr:polysaccharide lyase family 8 protein [Cordyceps fumosorosea ARSEF 2679]OAA69683.1 polysaccharide lyase family 8 protein [Cordyceps fumosorosea ARSEF 2679]